MATEKTYLKEGEKLPPRGNMDVLEPMIDDLNNRTEQKIKENEQAPLKTPTNRVEVRELLDPNNTGTVTTERAKESTDALQQGVSNSNFLVRRAVKNELEGVSPEEAKKNIEDRLGLKLESTETAAVIQHAVLKGANQEPLVAKGKTERNDKEETRENPKLSREDFNKIAAEQIRGMDKNGNLEVHKDETPEAVASIKKAISMLPNGIKKRILEESAKTQEIDPDGKKTAKELSQLAGISVTKEAALELRNAAVAGAKSPNPNPEVVKKETEEEKLGKDGKEKKNPFEEILTIIITFFKEMLGIKDDTVVAKKDGNPDKKEESAKGEVREQEKQQQAKLSPEEKQKSLAYLKELGDDFQNSIKNAGKELNGSGIMLAGLPKEFTPQAQIIGTKVLASDLQERG